MNSITAAAAPAVLADNNKTSTKITTKIPAKVIAMERRARSASSKSSSTSTEDTESDEPVRGVAYIVKRRQNDKRKFEELEDFAGYEEDDDDVMPMMQRPTKKAKVSKVSKDDEKDVPVVAKETPFVIPKKPRIEQNNARVKRKQEADDDVTDDTLVAAKRQKASAVNAKFDKENRVPRPLPVKKPLPIKKIYVKDYIASKAAASSIPAHTTASNKAKPSASISATSKPALSKPALSKPATNKAAPSTPALPEKPATRSRAPSSKQPSSTSKVQMKSPTLTRPAGISKAASAKSTKPAVNKTTEVIKKRATEVLKMAEEGAKKEKAQKKAQAVATYVDSDVDDAPQTKKPRATKITGNGKKPQAPKITGDGKKPTQKQRPARTLWTESDLNQIGLDGLRRQVNKLKEQGYHQAAAEMQERVRWESQPHKNMSEKDKKAAFASKLGIPGLFDDEDETRELLKPKV